MAIVYCYGNTKMEDAYAKRAAESLSTTYPNHSWWIECKGGILIIKHFGISSTIGMVRRTSSLDTSSYLFESEIKRAAGELLERAGLPRAAYDGEEVANFEAEGYRKHWLNRPGTKMKVIH